MNILQGILGIILLILGFYNLFYGIMWCLGKVSKKYYEKFILQSTWPKPAKYETLLKSRIRTGILKIITGIIMALIALLIMLCF